MSIRWLRTGIIGAGVFAIAGLILVTSISGALSAERSLQSTMADIERRWPDVDQMEPQALAGMLKSPNVIVFDVRQKAEFDVSHLSGAVHVDPVITAQAFIDRHGGAVAGKTVVVYCSVGMRSTGFAERIASRLAELGARVHNLSGGIFRWHGENRELVDAAGVTDYVHPYDDVWGRLVRRRDLARVKPRH